MGMSISPSTLSPYSSCCGSQGSVVATVTAFVTAGASKVGRKSTVRSYPAIAAGRLTSVRHNPARYPLSLNAARGDPGARTGQESAVAQPYFAGAFPMSYTRRMLTDELPEEGSNRVIT